MWNLKQESAGSARERDRDNEILVKQIQTGQGKRKELLERLWLDNLPLVQKIIHEMTGLERWKYSDIQDFEDLEQQAFLGILESIGKYEPDKGYKFFTFAIHFIRKSVLRYYDRNGQLMRIPAYMRAHIKRYAQECKKRNECQQPIDHESIREKLGMSKLNYESMRKVIARHETASLDTYLNESDPESGTLQDIIASNENVSQSVIESVTDRELHELMQKVLSVLPDNERNVIMLRFYQGHSMNHIANEFQCSRQNISDILKRAYIRIRHSKYANELIDFLPEYSMRNVYEKYETKYTSDKEKYEKASERLAKELSENERNLLL